MLRKIFLIAFLAAMIVSLQNCSFGPRKVRIAFSKGKGSPGYDNYVNWMAKEKNVECIDLYYVSRDSAMLILATCDGLVLTGGPDVEPGRYGKGWDTARCEVDPKRDTLEFKLIDYAFSVKMPVFAICRGEQILNVAMGGSLVVDIPSDVSKPMGHSCPNPDTCFHALRILENSAFREICKTANAIANTNHHQCVDRIADVFRPVAFSNDNVIEAYEWKDKSNKSFLLAVQWHPERMDENSPLSKPLKQAYLEAVRNNKK